jgi:hypothetical protein
MSKKTKEEKPTKVVSKKEAVKVLKTNKIFQYHLVDRMHKSLAGIKEELGAELKAMATKGNPDNSAVAYTDQSDLQLTLSFTSGRSSFDSEKAETYLRGKLGKKKFEDTFIALHIKSKVGVKPPKELINEMKKYFEITPVVVLDEGKILESGVSEADLKTNCYSKGDGTWKATTDKNCSNSRLLDIVNKNRQLNMDASSILAIANDK